MPVSFISFPKLAGAFNIWSCSWALLELFENGIHDTKVRKSNENTDFRAGFFKNKISTPICTPKHAELSSSWFRHLLPEAEVGVRNPSAPTKKASRWLFHSSNCGNCSWRRELIMGFEARFMASRYLWNASHGFRHRGSVKKMLPVYTDCGAGDCCFPGGPAFPV